eukprot:1741155-Prymnesium_polylepis.1
MTDLSDPRTVAALADDDGASARARQPRVLGGRPHAATPALRRQPTGITSPKVTCAPPKVTCAPPVPRRFRVRDRGDRTPL